MIKNAIIKALGGKTNDEYTAAINDLTAEKKAMAAIKDFLQFPRIGTRMETKQFRMKVAMVINGRLDMTAGEIEHEIAKKLVNEMMERKIVAFSLEGGFGSLVICANLTVVVPEGYANQMEEKT